MTDRRLNFDPSLERQRNAAQERQAEISARHTAPEWDGLLRPLVRELRTMLLEDRSASPLPAPVDLAAELAPAWDQIATAIADPDTRHLTSNDATQVMVDQVARVLGAEVANHPEEWRLLFECERLDTIAWSFAQQIDPAAIRRHVATICAWVPAPLFEAIERYMSERPSPEAVDEHLQELRSRELWSFVSEVQRHAESCMPSPLLRYVGTLGARGGADVCLRWLDSFRHPIALATAIAWIRDPEVLQAVFDRLGARDSPDEPLTMLVAMETVNALEAVERAVNNLLNPNFLLIPDERRREYQAEVDAWRTNELPARRTRWVQTASLEPLRFMASCFLRHTFTVRWRSDLEPLKIRNELRRELIDELCNTSTADYLVEQLLEHGPTYPSLLSAAIAATSEHATSETEERAVARVMRGYADMPDEEFAGRKRYHDDEGELASLLGATLAKTADPRAAWRDLEVRAPRRPRGWNTSGLPEHREEDKLEHVYVIGALASEWLVRFDRQPDAQRLFDELWRRVHRWARTLVSIADSERGTLALSQAWARLPIVRPDDATRLACDWLPRLDSPVWVCVCVSAFERVLADRDEPGLPSELRDTARDHFELLRPVWGQTNRTHDSDWRERAERRLIELGIVRGSAPP